MKFAFTKFTIALVALSLSAWGCADDDSSATGGVAAPVGGVSGGPEPVSGAPEMGGSTVTAGTPETAGTPATAGTGTGGTSTSAGEAAGQVATGGSASGGHATAGAAAGGTPAGGGVPAGPTGPSIDVAALDSGDNLAVTIVETSEGCPASVVAVSDKSKSANTAYIVAGPTGIGVIDAMSGDSLTDDMISLVTQVKGLYDDNADVNIEAYLTDSTAHNAGGASKMSAAGVTICGDQDGGHAAGVLSAECTVDFTDGPVEKAHGGVDYTHHQIAVGEMKKMAVHIPACGTLATGDLLSKNVHLNLGDGKAAGLDAWKDTLTTLVGEDGLIAAGEPTVILAGEGEVFPAAEAGAAATAMASYIDKAIELMAEANGAAVPDGNGDGHVDQADRALHIENGLAATYPDYASTAGNLTSWVKVACPAYGPNANGHEILMSLCGDSSAAAYGFRADAADEYVRVDRIGMPGVSTALLPSVADQGQLDQTNYNDASPADDLMGDYLATIFAQLTGIHDKLDDDLRAFGREAPMGGTHGWSSCW